jgi:hypothetical protein
VIEARYFFLLLSFSSKKKRQISGGGKKFLFLAGGVYLSATVRKIKKPTLWCLGGIRKRKEYEGTRIANAINEKRDEENGEINA